MAGLAPAASTGDPSLTGTTARLACCRPAVTAVREAGSCLSLPSRTLLHAGPPLCGPPPAPIANAAAVAVVFEGWARDFVHARALLQDGTVSLAPAQDYGAVVPLAAVLSESMAVLVVDDLAEIGTTTCAPLNGGLRHALRFGVADINTLEHLRWLNGELAPRLARRLDEPLLLLPLVAAALDLGDDCHGVTAAATAELADRWGIASLGGKVVSFFERAASFFLNPWMAASGCMLGAVCAEDDDVIVGMGGNGIAFGIRLAAAPSQWLTIPASVPAGSWSGHRATSAIGDSAVVEALGLGAMAWCRFQGIPAAASQWLSDSHARRINDLARPVATPLDSLSVISIRRWLEAGVSPPISLGVLDAEGRDGMLGRGLYQPPLALFQLALDATNQHPEKSR